jgi:hypothetical protein
VHGAHGSLAASPADGPALQQALDAIERHTRPGDPVLLAPQLTSLYVMSGRVDPLRQLSLLPGALADVRAEEQAIARMRDVRLVIADRTPLDVYDHGAFGTTFDRRLARWLHDDFQRLPPARGRGAAPRIIDIWMRQP